MEVSFFKVCILVFTLLNFLEADGLVTLEKNPGCINTPDVDCTSQPWVISVHNTADNKNGNDTEYFHVWGGMGALSLVVMKATARSVLRVNWSMLADHQPSAITAAPPPLNTFAVAITELILFNDPQDKGSIGNSSVSQTLSLPTTLFQWGYRIEESTDDFVANVTLYTTHFSGTEIYPNSSFNRNNVGKHCFLQSSG